MKKLSILVFILVLGTIGYTQSNTLFSNAHISGFGGPLFSISQVNGQTSTFAGGGGGIIIDNLFIGGFGEGVDVNSISLGDNTYDLDMGYGGLWLGYSLFSEQAVHPFVGLKLGGGEVNLNVDNSRINTSDLKVVIPEVGIELNFTSWMRLVTHLGYRKVGGMENNSLIKTDQLSSWTGGITLRFGFFR